MELGWRRRMAAAIYFKQRTRREDPNYPIRLSAWE
jgi:hypothetical protein